MRKLYALLVAVCSLFMLDASAQTVLFSEDFNTGGAVFNLNTADLGGSAGGANQWVLNSSYIGGNFTPTCLTVPLFPVLIGNTPNQPAGITGSPQSDYLHITSTEGLMNGIDNCHFIAASLLGCPGTESYFAAMNAGISTFGQTGVSLSFWWLCNGFAGSSYGEVYYSTNGGVSWNLVPGGPSEYSNQGDWTQTTISSSAFDNQGNLMFAFRFATISSFDSATDPAFAIDDLQITSTPASVNSITTDNITLGPYCPGQAISVPYTATGTFNAGNTFTAQLSNSSGSFASPVVIGTLSSTTSGVINANIPLGTPVGTNYLIRVVANSPNTIGTPSVITIEVAGAPTAAISNSSSTTVCSGGTASLIFQGSPGTIQWSSSTNNTTFTPIVGATSATYTTGPLTQTTYFQVSVTSSCGVTTSSTWTVTLTNAIVIPVSYTPNSLNLCNGPVTLSVTGNYTNLVWSNGQAGTAVISISNPITISVTGTDASGCSGASTPLTFTSVPPPPLSITPASPVTLCGSSATLTASAGFIAYNWSNGQTGSTVVVSSPGSFIVSATDANGCVVTSSATQVISGSSVSIPVEPSLAAICDGEPAVLTAGTGFSQYEWSNGAIGQAITVSATGYYSVTAVDVNGCPGSSPLVEVIQSQFPIANFAYSQGVGGYTISFNNNSQNGLSYEWAFDSIGTSPLRDPSFTFPDSGPYDITLIISNPCGSDTITKTIIVALVGIEDLGSGDEINVFPNPSDSDFHLVHTQASNTVSEIILRDLTGRLVLEKRFDTNQGLDFIIPGNVLPAGTYVACVHFKSGYRYYRIAKK